MMKTIVYFTLATLIFTACKKEQIEVQETVTEAAFIANNKGLTDLEVLGKKIFFDTNLSTPAGKSCASCHAPTTAFTDPNHDAFSLGSTGLRGRRNSPTVAYLAFEPEMYYNTVDGTWIGGFFVDGRKATLAAQAGAPMLDDREMNNTSPSEVVNKIKNAGYKNLYEKIYGGFTNDSIDFNRIGLAIQAYEKSKQINTFSSKYDYFISGKVELTPQEMRGLNVFANAAKGNCASCHPLEPDAIYNKVLFTDFSYDNIGVPTNPAQSFGVPDLGLGITKSDPNENGKFKVTTLRNIELTAPYFHNGFANTLEEVVQFYNKRDSDSKFSTPEVAQNLNRTELGNLKLNDQEVKDLIVFLKTLTDGFSVR
ncbi:MAG TPA: cytochrome c peroxidase [Chitinophagales bacterium]|nr:cytochrome c peroxidase [Chitinophagales bacterium]